MKLTIGHLTKSVEITIEAVRQQKELTHALRAQSIAFALILVVSSGKTHNLVQFLSKN